MHIHTAYSPNRIELFLQNRCGVTQHGITNTSFYSMIIELVELLPVCVPSQFPRLAFSGTSDFDKRITFASERQEVVGSQCRC